MTLSYCGETVRKHDPDRFLLSLFAPADRREDLWALYAFNHEIARTREVVTETQLGLIRLQWWRDALADFYNGRPPLKNPVLEALCAAIQKYTLPKEHFDTLIYAREFDLEDRQPAGLEGLEKYAEFTSAPLLSLSCVILSEAKDLRSRGEGEDPSAAPQDDSIRNVAIAYALTGILRATPLHLRQRRCTLPVTNVQDLYEGRALDSLKPLVEEVVHRALAFLAAPAKAGGHGSLVHLHAVLARMYLKQIVSAGYDLFAPVLKIPPFAREVRLWWANLTY